jgi:hypothetical protein
MRNAIGPWWDGNEVWLIVAGGATFAAFPVWYAGMFSGFYLALFIVLAALFPRVMVSSGPGPSLTIWSAASANLTLVVMTVAAAIFIPLVLGYQGWSFWVFRQRLTRPAASLAHRIARRPGVHKARRARRPTSRLPSSSGNWSSARGWTSLSSVSTPWPRPGGIRSPAVSCSAAGLIRAELQRPPS